MRSVGAGFEIDLTGGTDSVSLQPVGAESRRRAYLAVGRPGPLSAADRHLVNAAVMLLTLGFEHDAVAPDAAASVRTAALDIALNGHLDLARSVAARLGAPLPDDPMVVLVGRSTAAAPAPAIADKPAVAGAFAALLDDELVVLAPLNSTDSVTAASLNGRNDARRNSAARTAGLLIGMNQPLSRVSARYSIALVEIKTNSGDRHAAGTRRC